MTVREEWEVESDLVENIVLSDEHNWWLSCCWENSLSSREKFGQGPELNCSPE